MNRIARSTLASSHCGLRTRGLSSVANNGLVSNYSSVAGNNTGLGESTSLFPRQQEFARKRFLYFSSGTPNDFDRNRIHQLIKNDQLRKEMRQQPTIDAASLVVPISDYLEGDSRNGNRSLISIPSSRIESQQHRYYSTATKGGKCFKTIGPYSLRALDSFAPVSAAFISTSTSTLQKSETPKPTLSMDQEDEKGEGTSPTESASAANSKQQDSEETGWKRVRTIKVPKYGQDADKAVRSLQSARKERARIKTSINVQRALYGNMVICAAKLGAWISSGSSSMMSEFV